MDNNKLKVLDGMDAYLPYVDGVVNCMHNYCMHSYQKVDLTAIAPRYQKDYVETVPYTVKRCKSIKLNALKVQYCQATRDKKFTKEILSKRYDIVHVHSPFNMAKFMVKIAKKQGIPAVATFHTNMRPIVRQQVKSKWLTELLVKHIGKIYNKYDEVFVCSPLVAEQCRSFGYKGKISYLPFGTDLPRCDNKEELAERANAKFNIGADELVFLYVGRIEKLKRIDMILDSLKILKDKGIKFRFIASGKGTDYDKIVKYKQKSGFTDDEVDFAGFLPREDLPLLNARADLLLFPSLYDNFALVKVEAAAYGTPGVFIEGSCTGYGVTDGVNGFLSKDTVKDFADKIEQAVSDRNFLKEVGRNASRDLYVSWEECTNQYIQRLKEIVERYNNGNKK